MKRFAMLLIFSAAAFAQTPPQLSTADKIALQKFEKDKQDATKLFNDAVQSELQIAREWGTAHPGFHLHLNTNDPGDPKNFTVEADEKAKPAKTEAPKPAEPEKK